MKIKNKDTAGNGMEFVDFQSYARTPYGLEIGYRERSFKVWRLSPESDLLFVKGASPKHGKKGRDKSL